MRLIDADRLKLILRNSEYMDACVDEKGNTLYSDHLLVGADYDDVCKAIDEQPTVELEREKGDWTNDASCPFCGFQPWYEKDIHTLSFCPNCGADMKKE